MADRPRREGDILGDVEGNSGGLAFLDCEPEVRSRRVIGGSYEGVVPWLLDS